MIKTVLEWDERKELINYEKHGINFTETQEAFFDPRRVIAEDIKHSTQNEPRYYCFGKVGERVLTVRFTYRTNKIRIIGAGYWREGKDIYKQKNESLLKL